MPLPPNVSSAPASGADAPGAERPLTCNDSSIKVVLPTTTSTVVVTSATTTFIWRFRITPSSEIILMMINLFFFPFPNSEGGFERSDYNGVIHKSEIPNTEEGFDDDDYEEEEEEEEDSNSEEDEEEVVPSWRFKGKPRSEVVSNPPSTNTPRAPRGPSQNGKPIQGTANGTATTQQKNGGQTGDRRGRS